MQGLSGLRPVVRWDCCKLERRKMIPEIGHLALILALLPSIGAACGNAVMGDHTRAENLLSEESREL